MNTVSLEEFIELKSSMSTDTLTILPAQDLSHRSCVDKRSHMSTSKVPKRRYPPGQDPAKRAQILEGANRVICRIGYDAANVSDIALEAGVSKGTIYAYFADKLELFEALMQEMRDELFRPVGIELTLPGPVGERLTSYGTVLTRTLCSEAVVQAHRVTIGVADRMPDLARRFHERGELRGTQALANFLRSRINTKELEIEDVDLAASQFIELCLASLFRRRLLGDLNGPPEEEAISRSVSSAVAIFLLRYARD